MNSTKITGLVVIIVGAALLLFSDYIAQEVAEGREQIQQGQQSVDTLDSLFSQSQYTKSVGKTFTGSAQKRIDRGNREVAKYGALSNQLQIGGIILIVVGIGIFFFWKKKRR